MKTILKTLLLLILVSCANNKSEEKSIKNNESTKQNITEEKVWEEFTINSLGNTMMEMKFDVKNITVSEGSWVRIKLINQGIDEAMQHNIIFIKFGSREEVAKQALAAGADNKYVPTNNTNVISASDLAMPGETVTLEFKAPERGNYEFFCSYPGHSEMMRGYFFVK